jgi:hypothetical protein
MALSQSDLDALDAAIASGRLSVRFADRMVTYHSIAELIKARDHVAKVISSSGGISRRAPRYQTAVFDDA